MTSHTVQIARQEGKEFRSVHLRLDDGGIRFDVHDMGPRVGKVWGGSEYEYLVHVASEALPMLAFELLREKFAGRLDAADAFRDWCKAHGIVHEVHSWP